MGEGNKNPKGGQPRPAKQPKIQGVRPAQVTSVKEGDRSQGETRESE